jgi:hypothetical protein
MGIKGKFYISGIIILMIVIGCSSSQLPKKNVDNGQVFSKYELRDNLDKEAFHIDITVFEEDSTPSQRRIRFNSHSSKVYEGGVQLSYRGMRPQLMPKKNGNITLDYREPETLDVSIWNSHIKIPPIPVELGKSLKVVLYLNSADDY